MYLQRMDTIHVRIKSKIFKAGATQAQVAHVLGVDPSLFSRIVKGFRPMPADFEKCVDAALDRLERAEKAGRKAYEKALAEGA